MARPSTCEGRRRRTISFLRGDILPTTQVSASAVTGPVPVPQVSMVAVAINISAVSGSNPVFDAWLQCSDDNGTNWYDIPYDQQITTSASGSDVVGQANRRNINGTSSATGTGQHISVYKHLPSNLIRLRYAIGGSFSAGQGFTFSAKWLGK